MYTPMPSPVLQFWNAAGTAIVPLGKVYSYEAGTDTPRVTHSNSAGANNDNPLILDAYGRGTLFLDTSLSYKIKLTTAADVEVWTQDNVAVTTGLRHVTSATSATSVTSATSATSATTATNLSGAALATSGGKITTYNSIATAGNGVPQIVAAVDVENHEAAFEYTTLYVVPAAGSYRISAYGTRLVGGFLDQLIIIIYYKNQDGAQTNWNVTNTIGGPYYGQGALTVQAAGGSTLSYAASCGGPGVYFDMHIRLEKL